MSSPDLVNFYKSASFFNQLDKIFRSSVSDPIKQYQHTSNAVYLTSTSRSKEHGLICYLHFPRSRVECTNPTPWNRTAPLRRIAISSRSAHRVTYECFISLRLIR
ncbi:hypothetical protein Y032_0842g2634 [Ancylostoma ceylanicum]|uniref:Uncharacterized protein n=1 Tax=Ancylostoma ceylanicum TaxID=53326 RepID=A0A016WBC2_9BILA|nr:hypothetical protein Y032_0842g2634 [Ancylostoma ceylanicum]